MRRGASPPIRVKGIPDPMRSYVVLRARPRTFGAISRGVDGVESPLIGRDADKIEQTMGKSVVNEFLRFYVAVGIFHNRNVGRNPVTNALVPAYVDFIAMLDDWVEHGRAPSDTQVLSDMDTAPPFAVHATFPMCRYPMYPRYQGKGDPKAAGSYACMR